MISSEYLHLKRSDTGDYLALELSGMFWCPNEKTGKLCNLYKTIQYLTME